MNYIRLSMGLAALAAALLLSHRARPHEFTSPTWDYCCGGRDCNRIPGAWIETDDNGYVINFPAKGYDRYDFGGQHMNIPYKESTPSPDDSYWLCMHGGSRRCFFAPNPKVM